MKRHWETCAAILLNGSESTEQTQFFERKSNAGLISPSLLKKLTLVVDWNGSIMNTSLDIYVNWLRTIQTAASANCQCWFVREFIEGTFVLKLI